MLIRRFLPLILVLAFGCIEPLLAVAAITKSLIGEPTPVLGVTQQDLNADGTPDVTVIDCAFATGHDRVLVYDRNGDMPTGTQWQEITDFQDDVWVFDAGADGTAQLIVAFDVEGERHVALVYDDIDGDGQVRYDTMGDKIMVEESSFWHVKVESEQAWTQSGGEANMKLTFLIDGYDGLGYALREGAVNQGSGTDGVIDWQIDIGDKDGDGTIDYQLQRVISPVLVDYRSPGFHKTAIRVQTTDRPPEPYANTMFWSLLLHKADVGDLYFDHPPAIAVDWETGRIDQIGVLGYPIEAGYHVFSRLPLEKYTVNAVDWENPMAYYDMANDQDGWPELQVRFDVAVPYDPYFPYPHEGKVETPNLEVNYSWDQDNDNRWDYKMNLGANYPIYEVVEFPDFAVKSVPYDQIIPWVRDRTWDVAMFIQDNRPSPDSEGMFGKGWMIHRGYADRERVEPSGVKDKYLMGFSDRPPTENYQDIEEGMRGEYSFQYFDRPKMYLSTLDRQLHLSGAQAGVRNLGGDHRLRYTNLEGDAYLDQWQDERDGMVIQQLNYGHGVFVHSGNGDVRMKQSDLGPALFETQPPGNYEEWQRLDAQLRTSQPALSPDDFAGMLDRLSGSEVLIQGAAARDYRITPQGFRFVLELQPEFRVHDDQDKLASLPETPGTYLVEYDGQTWSVRTATPAVLHVSALEVDPQDGMLQAQRWATIETLVHNDGLEDVHDLPVCVTLDDPIGRRVVMTDTVSLLPGEGLQSVVWDWTPAASGSWRIQVVAYCSASEETAFGGEVLGSAVVQVADTVKPSTQWLVSLGGRVPESIALFLFATVAMAGIAAVAWVKESRP